MRRSTTYAHNPNAALPEQILAALLAGVILFAVAAAALVFGYQMIHSGSIYPGVRIAGVDVGGMTRSAAVAHITASFQYPQTGTILLRDGSQTWLVRPSEIGLFFDPQTSIERAFTIGRSGGLVARLRQQFDSNYYGSEVAPAFLFDQRLTYNYLAALAREIDRPVIEATLTLQGTEVIVQPGEIGRRLDIEATLQQISMQMQSLQDGIVPLVIVETPPAIMDASLQAEQARKILSQPLTLSLPSDQPDQKGPWVIQPEMLAGMLSIERAVPEYRVGINPSLLRTYLGNLAPSVDVYPQNARFIFNDDTRLLEVIEKSTTGRSLDVETTIQAVQAALTSGKHTVPLAFNFIKPGVEDTATGEELGITELVHAETSWFYGSGAARVQNIEAAASRFHGVLVPPGATFSMSDQLGDISLDNGYAEAMIILGGRTIKGVGGGVCQVSTTLFRAAFFAGFQIVERHAHAYRVYYYEKVGGNRIDTSLAGLDATVFVPLVDFKFRNDTQHWLLMETYVNPGSSSITWKFYSTKDGRSVDWTTTGPINVVEAPKDEYNENPELAKDEFKQVDWAADGADVTVVRTVLRDGAVYLSDTFVTHYEPWANVYEYGPGSELPSEDDEE